MGIISIPICIFTILWQNNIVNTDLMPYYVVILGAMHTVVAKGLKYSFFDPLKEIAYIQLPLEKKIKGKTFMDTIGSKAGKTTSSMLYVSIMSLLSIPSIIGSTPYVLPILISVLCLWIWSNYKLFALYDSKSET